MIAGWKQCDLEFRTRPVLDSVEDSDLEKPEQEPEGTIPFKFRRF